MFEHEVGRTYVGTENGPQEVKKIYMGTKPEPNKYEIHKIYIGLLGKKVSTVFKRVYSWIEAKSNYGEHISAFATAKSFLAQIFYHVKQGKNEHISVNALVNSKLTYGLSSKMISITNIDSKTIILTTDYPVHGGKASDFTLIDSNGISYPCTSISCSNTTITLTFIDFSIAARATELTLSFTQSGALYSPIVLMKNFEVKFTPIGLIDPGIEPPTFYQAWNNSDGTEVILELTEEPLDGMLNAARSFTIKIKEYKHIPNEETTTSQRTVKKITPYYSIEQSINLSNSSRTNVMVDSQNNIIKLNEGATEGECIFIIPNTDIITNAISSEISWTETVSENTKISVFSRLGNGELVPCANGGSLSAIVNGADLSTSVAYIVVKMSTQDELKSPEFTNLQIKIRNADDVKKYVLHLNTPSIRGAIDSALVIYDQTDAVRGIAGPMQAFSGSFVPQGMDWAGNTLNNEHISALSSAFGILTKISYASFCNKEEHINVTASARGVLTDIKYTELNK